MISPNSPISPISTIQSTIHPAPSDDIYVIVKTRTLHDIHCLDVVAYPCIQHTLNTSVFSLPDTRQAEDLVEILRIRFGLHAEAIYNANRASYEITWKTDTVNATLPIMCPQSYLDTLDRMGVRIICKCESEHRYRLRLPYVGAQLPVFVRNISDYDPMEYIPPDARVLKVVPRNGAYFALIKPLQHANCEILERMEYYIKIRTPLDNVPDVLYNNALIETVEIAL